MVPHEDSREPDTRNRTPNKHTIKFSVFPKIRSGQTVVLSYADPTDGDDQYAIQDEAGNDAASFTTGSSGVPAVTNDSTFVDTAAPAVIEGSSLLNATESPSTVRIRRLPCGAPPDPAEKSCLPLHARRRIRSHGELGSRGRLR